MKVGDLFFSLGMRVDATWNQAQKRIRAIAALSRQKDREMASSERARVRESMRLERLRMAEARRAAREQARLERIRNRGVGNMGLLGASRLARGALMGAGAFTGAHELVTLADDYTLMHNRLRLVAQSEAEVNQLFERGREVARNTRSDLKTTVEGFVRVQQSVEGLKLGLSKDDVFTRLELINMAIKNSGASTVEAKQGFRQLAQAMSSNRLGGEEMRAVLEEVPAVADAIAKSLGVTRGQLRQMSKDGKLTTKVILEAFNPSKAKEIRDAYGKTVGTIGDQFQQFKNELTVIVGEFFKDAEAVEAFKVALKGVLEFFKLLIKGIKFFVDILRPAIQYVQRFWRALSGNSTFMSALSGIGKVLLPVFKVILKFVGLIVMGFWGIVYVIGKIVDSWDTIKDKAKSVWNAIIGFVTDTANAIKNKFLNAWDTVKNAIIAAFEFIAELPVIKQLIAIASDLRAVLGGFSSTGAFDFYEDFKRRKGGGDAATANTAGTVINNPDGSKRTVSSPVTVTNHVVVKDAGQASQFVNSQTSDALERQNRHAAAALVR